MDLKIAGQAVLISGASQGIGAGLAEVFSEEGCSLKLVARSADKLAAVAPLSVKSLTFRFPGLPSLGLHLRHDRYRGWRHYFALSGSLRISARTET
jgi:NAD(P)-dependent dehydrogenase (short-subunit alcohol dehydrogenase family)